MNYRKEELDLLCASGEVIWIGCKDEGDKEGKIAFFLASSKSLYEPFLNGTTQEPTKHPKLLKLLEEGGASFLTRLSRETDKPPSELIPDLLELVWEGRVSNDQFAPLRLHANVKSSRWAKTGSGLGRWYATSMLSEEDAYSAQGEEAAATESPVLTWVNHLLKGYGMINKELTAKAAPFSWDTFYPMLKRLEEWGALTRGTFIKGMSTLQFTTRELSDTVRKPLPVSSDTSSTVLSSADPANPFGLIIDWPQSVEGASFARKPGNYLVLKGDRWLYWIENNGKRIFSLPGSHAEVTPVEEQAALLKAAFQSIIRRQGLVKISVDLWDGETVTDTDAGKRLLQLGAERDLKSLVFWSN
ncbi:Lhr family helicase [Cohnella kolymensis]|uniref:Lhr family helicase n=1 Tax=Cohnella kolymensis TaxID=1590652 RepID=UPI000A823955|nr:hypothetical protein [Cohnella kolymensis]